MNIIISLTEKECEQVINALAFRPFGEVFNLINNINNQVVTQLNGKGDNQHEKN